MKITLSFDNGPDPEVTPQVLDVLAARELRASFFVVGEKLRDRSRYAACERAHAEGHWLGNHTFNHLTPFGIAGRPEVSRAEIARTQALLGDLAHPDRLFRPFGGGGALDRSLLDRGALAMLQEEAYTCVLWNAVPRDWEAPDDWVARALEQCAALDWALLVLHDLPTGAMAHLDRFLGEAEQRGARFVQDFPPGCVPVRRGEIVLPIDDYVAEDA